MKDEELLLTKKLDFDDVSLIINDYINNGIPRNSLILKCSKDYKLTKKEANVLIDMIETQIKENFKNKISKLIPIALDRQEYLYSIFMQKKDYIQAYKVNNEYIKNLLNLRNGTQNKNATNLYQNNKQINITFERHDPKGLNSNE
jgi:hypothetical protein